MLGDPLDKFIEHDAGMGWDMVECPHRDAQAPCSLFFLMT
jgi:hypothetical protein